jgi:hypothetical protein
MLVHHAQASDYGLSGRRKSDSLAIEKYLSRRRTVKAEQDVHERRLAGAIFAEEGYYLAFHETYGYFAVRGKRSEKLADAARFEDRRICGERRAGFQ